MTKREISRLIESPLPGALLNSITEDIGKCRFHQSMDSLALRMGFLVPLRRVVQGVGNPFSHDTFIELSLADLKEETANSRTINLFFKPEEIFDWEDALAPLI